MMNINTNSKYDWSNVPDWVNWIFTDQDGDVFGSDNKPDDSDGFHGRPHIDTWYYVQHNPCEDWQNSLEERPK